MIVAATGHRPDKLGGYDDMTRRALGALAVEWLHYNRPDRVISGMALGWDQAVAAAAAVLGIPFIAAVPFEGQDRTWPSAARQRYRRLLNYADEVCVVNDCMSYKAFQRRNEWMVDRADLVLALWNGSFGGTHNCVEYSHKKSVPVRNLWGRWTMPEEDRALIG